MKISTKQLTAAALLLALAIVSQFFKGLSVYITGPIVNLILIITTLYCGILCGVALSIVTPVTAFLISGSPLMSMVPMIIPCIMIGNAILVVVTGVIYNKISSMKSTSFGNEVVALAPAVVIASIAKAVFMGVSINMIVIPVFGPNVPEKLVKVAQTQFSITQLITALIAGVIACIIWPTLKVAIKNLNR